MPSRRYLAAVPEAELDPRRPDLREAVKSALDNMPWLGPSDAAMKTLATRQAEEIEKAIDRAEEYDRLTVDLAGDEGAYKRLKKLEAMCDVTKTVGWLGPQLQGVLRDLGGTPTARALLQKDKPAGGRLEQIRQAAGNAATRVDEA